ncbi:MAG: hypothetical protein Q7J80_10270, partial [Anaerolineales bacterium]|nr:hypothetical protein [Anaerolineales bacterium]
MNSRTSMLVISFLALLALLGLAAALHDVQFSPAQPFGQTEAEIVQVSISELLEQISDVPFWQQILFWLILFLLV